MVMRSCDVDAARERAKTRDVAPKLEIDMMPHEVFDLKVKQWNEGSMYCQDADKGRIVEQLIERINMLNEIVWNDGKPKVLKEDDTVLNKIEDLDKRIKSLEEVKDGKDKE